MIGKIIQRLKAKIVKPDYIIYNNFCIPSKALHRNVAQRVLSRKVNEKETVEAIKEYYTKGAIVHAGTFFGDMLPYFNYADAVYAFEPNNVSFKATKVTITLNDINNVVLYNNALGDYKGTAMSKTKNGNQKTYIMKLDEIHTLYNDGVSVIHLDLEGYETLALMGAISIIKRFSPTLILETYDEDFMYTIDYQLIKKVNFNTIWRKK